MSDGKYVLSQHQLGRAMYKGQHKPNIALSECARHRKIPRTVPNQTRQNSQQTDLERPHQRSEAPNQLTGSPESTPRGRGRPRKIPQMEPNQTNQNGQSDYLNQPSQLTVISSQLTGLPMDNQLDAVNKQIVD